MRLLNRSNEKKTVTFHRESECVMREGAKFNAILVAGIAKGNSRRLDFDHLCHAIKTVEPPTANVAHAT